MRVTAEGIQVNYGDVPAVRDVSYTVETGNSLVLLGPSGCGKTTIMRALAGLEKPAAGKITVGDRVLFDSHAHIDVATNMRNIGMVFQSYAVWPHKTVFDNVVFPLKMQRVSKADREQRVLETLEMLGLQQFADRSASMLSGGQMQRVALARSLVMRPDVLLLDEPLSNLDARLRDRLRLELRELQLELNLTCVYVTHDQSEAMALADEIIVMRNGEIAQRGAPTSIYSQPATADIARFLGVNNVISTAAMRQNPAADSAITEISGDYGMDPDQGFACFRAENVTVSPTQPSSESMLNIPGKVVVSSFEGSAIRYQVEIAPQVNIESLTPVSMGTVLPPGERVYASLNHEAIRVLDEQPAGRA